MVILYREEGSVKGLLFVWHQEGEEEIVVPVRAKRAVRLYPQKAEEEAVCRDTIKVTLKKVYSGRLFQIEF